MMAVRLILGVCLVALVECRLRSPLVLVPGIFGNQIEAKLNKTSAPYFYCEKRHDWYTLWLNIEILSKWGDYCFADNAKLVYDPRTKQYRNNHGVETRIPGFGDTKTIEHLDEFNKAVPYFHEMVRYFTNIGYKINKDIRGAPYDWRFAADGQVKNGYYRALQELIEETFKNNNKTPVTIVAHSMGGPITQYFLSHFVQEEWKASRIKQFISLSGAFGGSMKSIQTLVSGEVERAISANPRTLRVFERTLPSVVWMTPSSLLWNDTEVIVTTKKRNYTARDKLALFSDLDYANGTRMYYELRNVTDDFSAPNVTHYCFYGNKVHTPERLVYDDSFPDSDPDYVYGNGDGTVNIRSLESCGLWKNKQQFAVQLKSFDGVLHFDIVSNKTVLKEIEKLVT